MNALDCIYPDCLIVTDFGATCEHSCQYYKDKIMTVPTKTNADHDVMESVIAKGDLSKLTPEQRVEYYNAVCKSLGLNPLTKPFEYHTLNGKLILYGNRSAADQLRKIHGISVSIISQEFANNVLTIHVKAHAKDGREDEDLGVVAFSDAFKGELRANQIMKAVTKAKRRVTLSICGLGWLDETEVEDAGRENPHATRVEDITTHVDADDPDRIPMLKEQVIELPKMQQREVAEKLGHELANCKTLAELINWKNLQSTSYRAWQLREMWREVLQGRVKEKFMELRGAAEQAAFEHEEAAQQLASYHHEHNDTLEQ